MAKKKKKRKRARKERDLVKLNTIKSYVSDILKIRINKTAADRTRGSFNALLKATLIDAKARAKADDRTTIMPRDLDAAIDKVIEKKNLNPKDLAREINKLSAVELAELVDAVDAIREKRKRAR